MFDETVPRILNYAYFYLKFRPRSRKEVSDYLKKKGDKLSWTPEQIEAAILDLEEKNFVNDADFVEWFVHSRNSGKPKGRPILTSELMLKGVPKDTIDTYFEVNPPDSEALILKALERKWSSFRFLDKQIRFQKAASYLQRRGFPFSLIKKTIAQLEEKE